MNSVKSNTVAVIGLGYIGLPILASLARCGNRVFGIDTDENRIKQLRETYAPNFYEPELREILQEYRHNIEFTTDYKHASECSTVLITVGTPLQDDQTPSYDQLDAAMGIGRYISKGCTVILKSTVIPGTTEQYVIPRLEQLSGLHAGRDFYVAFCPERTVEGAAIRELSTLPKIIGGIDKESTERAASFLSQLGDKIIKVSSPKVAELCKLVDNTFRAMNVAFANEIGMMCEQVGIDAYEVVAAVNNSYERTKLFTPGLGADGPCLHKDCHIFRTYARSNKADSSLVDASVTKSTESTLRIEAIVSRFIEDKKIEKPVISLVGLAFKGSPPTDDIRESTALKIYEEFLKNTRFSDFIFRFHDPLVSRFCETDVCATFTECVQEANVVMFLTNNPDLMNIDAHDIAASAGRPLLIIDCWHNVTNLKSIANDDNIDVFQVGSGWLKK